MSVELVEMMTTRLDLIFWAVILAIANSIVLLFHVAYFDMKLTKTVVEIKKVRELLTKHNLIDRK